MVQFKLTHLIKCKRHWSEKNGTFSPMVSFNETLINKDFVDYDDNETRSQRARATYRRKCPTATTTNTATITTTAPSTTHTLKIASIRTN
ncbi:unnamed protein product [Rhizophagus irregularis]|nr:unnamed protein product [Rhizophagus irregularis]CAB5300823.1 unnamed protein product [Rhizophagus irregularis]